MMTSKAILEPAVLLVYLLDAMVSRHILLDYLQDLAARLDVSNRAFASVHPVARPRTEVRCKSVNTFPLCNRLVPLLSDGATTK